MAIIPFVGQQLGRSPNLGAAHYINIYPHQSLDGSISFIGTPGAVIKWVVGARPIRGMHVANGVLYIVAGDTVYKTTGEEPTAIGSIGTSAGPVTLAWNGTQLVISDGALLYIYDSDASTFDLVTDVLKSGLVCFLDGYFITNAPGSNTYLYSELYDGLQWDALSFNAAESSPDNVVAVVSIFGFLYVLGETSAEIWYNAGDPDTVFRRVDGVTSAIGCVAPYSAAKVGDTGSGVMWLACGEQGCGFAVISTGGALPVRVSTEAVEYQWAKYSRINDAFAYSYTQEGHSFYVVTFPSGNATWVYDLATQTWHERKSGDNAHFSSCHAFYNGQHLLGSSLGGQIYVSSLDYSAEDGRQIVREIVGPTIGTGESMVSFVSVQIDMQRGHEMLDLAGNRIDREPSVMLFWSDDDGNTWSAPMVASCGRIGEFKRRVMFRRLGRSFRRAFKIRITDPVQVVIKNALVDYI